MQLLQPRPLLHVQTGAGAQPVQKFGHIDNFVVRGPSRRIPVDKVDVQTEDVWGEVREQLQVGLCNAGVPRRDGSSAGLPEALERHQVRWREVRDGPEPGACGPSCVVKSMSTAAVVHLRIPDEVPVGVYKQRGLVKELPRGDVAQNGVRARATPPLSAMVEGHRAMPPRELGMVLTAEPTAQRLLQNHAGWRLPQRRLTPGRQSAPHRPRGEQ
mmetsp:Transcript_75407/g.233249  ORF Transcript_75407/g.233249 Transcript_75407/m.233249 type:complete len:214 (-) Transcript_75407:159-800(-)